MIGRLKNTRIKNNLYYEVKEQVLEDRPMGISSMKRKQKVKSYGLDSSKKVRDILIDILHQRMDYHKDKFISPIIMEELNGLEIKKNRVDHSSKTHDDQIFSMLMALYVWYYGKDIMSNWGIRTYNIRTDEEYQESIIDNEQQSSYTEVYTDNTTDDNDEVNEQIEYMKKGMGITFEQWMLREEEKDEQARRRMMSNKLYKEAYNRKYNVSTSKDQETPYTFIPDEVFMEDFGEDTYINDLNKQFMSIGDMR